MRRIATIATFAGAFLCCALSIAQPVPPRMDIVVGLRPSTQARPEQQAQLRMLQGQRGAGQISIARLQTQLLRATPVGQGVQFQVAPGRTISARALSVETNGSITTWRGEVAGQAMHPPGSATLVITPAGVTGTIHSNDGRTYRLRPLPSGETAIIELNYNTMPPDHPPQATGRQSQLRNPAGPAGTVRVPQAQAVVGSPPAAQRLASAPINEASVAQRLQGNTALQQRVLRPSNVSLVERYRFRPDIWRLLTPPTIDVLVAYTPSAQAASGDILGLINLAIEETNGSFTNSNVWARVRLVGTTAVSYTEAGRTYDTIIGHFAGNGDGQMDGVHAQRDSVKADVAVLLINQPDYCGQAAAIGADASQAYVIVHWDCATGYYSFGHEIAHLAGARHDEPTDTTDTPYAWGHGFRHQAAAPAGWRTIMGYNCASSLCAPRLQYWSSPLSTWNGLPMGSAADADNHRVWNDRAATLAAFR